MPGALRVRSISQLFAGAGGPNATSLWQALFPRSAFAPLMNIRRHTSLTRVAILVACLGMLAPPARAAEHRFDLLLDTDNSAVTGCTVAEPAQSVGGIEQKLSVYVDTSTTGATVNRVTRQVCAAGVLGAETVLDASGWPVGAGVGTGGNAVIEAYVARNLLPATGTLRVTTASDTAGTGDIAPAFTLDFGGVAPPPPPPPSTSDVVPVPLAPWLSGTIALLLVLGTLHWHRRHPQHASLCVLVLLCGASTLVWAASVLLDGQVSDWSGISASVTDPQGDAPVDTDIVAVFTQRDTTRLYFRIDADVQPDAGGRTNTPPLVSAGADQSVTLPATATLSGSASDDGLPNPPGALTLTWSAPVAPAAVAFADAHAATTTATFTQPGSYTLRLTASDSVLSASSDMHVTVTNGSASLTLAPVADSNILVGTHFRAPLTARASGPATLTYALVTAPPGASIAAGPTITWTPSSAQLGSNTFNASVSDGLGHSATTTFTVTVAYTNHPPQLGAQPDATLPAGGEFSRVLTANDPDAGDTLAYALVAGPPGLTLSGATLDWATGSTLPGDYEVTVKVSDAGGLGDTRHFVIRLTPAAPPPVANDDRYDVRLGETLVVPAPGVLANDVDPSGGSLAAHKGSDPDKGSLTTFNADGSFSYAAPSTIPGPVFQPVLKWDNEAVNGTGSFNPVVADVFANGHPVAFVVRWGFEGGVTAVDGATGATLWSVDGSFPAPHDGCFIQVQTSSDAMALGDIDDSGAPAIVLAAKCYADYSSAGSIAARIVALDARTGAVKWLTAPLGTAVADPGGGYYPMANYATPTIARLHPTETPSVLFKVDAESFIDSGATQYACAQFQAGSTLHWCTGVMVLDGADGSVRRRFIAPSDNVGRENYTRAHVMVADLTGSGSPNVIANGAVWDADGNLVSNRLGVRAYSLALAQLDDSGQVSIISQEPGFVVARHADGSVQWQSMIYGGGATDVPGNLSVADLDGDGSPDITTTLEGFQFAYDAKGEIKWIHHYADGQGFRTIDQYKRPAVFDLDGDGIAEVIMPTTLGLEFTDGKTGVTRTVVPWPALGVTNTGQSNGLANAYSTSAVVADVDGSGHASILLTVPLYTYLSSQYLVAVGAQNNDWRPAPTVYNEYSYHVSNVDNVGHIPLVEADNFSTPRTNVFGNQAQAQDPVDPRAHSSTSFTYAASNATLASDPATVTINIHPQNSPPVFVSVAPTVYVPESFTYAAHATDADPGDSVTYSMLLASGNAAASCAIGATTGLLTCPSLFFGEQYITIVATDTQGVSAYQTLRLAQSAGSAVVPSVVGEQQADAATTLSSAGFVLGNVSTISSGSPAGQVLSQSPSGDATAVLGEAVAVTVSSGPAPVAVPDVVGLGLPAANGILGGLGFTPAPTYAFSPVASVGTVLAQTPAAGTLLAPIPANPVGMTVSLGEAPSGASLASMVVTPAQTAALVGKTAAFTNRAIYSDHSARDFTHVATWSSSDTSVATVDGNGVAHALHAGTTTITAVVGAIAGNATLHVSAPVPGDATLPVALITAPAGGSEVTGVIPVVGTATDANFLRYELSLAASTDTTFTTIGQGAAPVSSGVLGSLDPTLLLNGAYTLRLTVYDAGGNTTVANTTIVVSGAQKVGNFTLSYTDLTVPLAGIPIQVTRNYDSRDKHMGDFGVGWSLGISALQVSTSGVVGESWEVGLSGTTYFLIPDVNHFVSVTLPSGRVETFDVQLSPTTSPLQQFSTLQATFVPRAGVQGTLQSLDNTNLLIADPQPGPITLIDDTTLNTFNPDRFIYTERDGTRFVVTRSHGVESVKDTNGNQISITPGGISHSSGANIVFDRDTSGRILGITDPAGSKRAYAYTANGDLGAATDRSGNTTRYTYDGQHDVLRVDDPLGRPIRRADYDENGRLIALTDAAGHTTHYNHDLPGRQEQVTDALGRTRVLNYDERGNVLSSTDPLGNTTFKTYDAQDNLLTETDPLGHTTSHTYDAQRDLLSTTDALGRTTSFAYDAAGHLLTTTSPRGFAATTTYDAQGNPTRTVDALGNALQTAFDANGNRTSITGPDGATTLNQYDAAGRRTQVSDPAGSATLLHYDDAGNLVGQNTGSGANGLAYDADGRIVGTTNGAASRVISRDPTGAVAAATTSAGAAMLVSYDPAGRFAGLADATSGNSLAQRSYDAVGNLTSITDAAGSVTSFAYDADNRLLTTTAANGASLQNIYDAGGNLVSRIDALGHAMQYQYDAAGQLTAVIDALGGTTRSQYDADGNLVARIDAAGRTTSFTYDAAGRQVATTYADGSQESTTYDTVGDVLTKTDAAGHTTTYAYDLLRRVTSVTDALGHLTTFHYTGSGAADRRTDANGHVTQFAYDDHSRLVQTVHPLGDGSTATYDDAGHTLSTTNGAGELTAFEYDTQGRVSRVTRADHSTATYAYTSDGLVASISDTRGATAYQYDPSTRQVVRVTEPDGRYVRYGYDAGGRQTLLAHGDTHTEAVTLYDYDALGHVVKVTAPDHGVTQMTYDAVGHLASMVRANGVKTSYAYDLRDRPAVIEVRNAANGVLSRETYSVDADGNRIRIDYADSSHVEYQYDALDRVVRERHFDGTSSLQADLVYAYDAVGNRTSAGSAAAPASFAYNANDQLVSGGGVSYAYDAAGRRIRESWSAGSTPFERNYHWDGEDRLIAFDDSSSAADASYLYDDYGERVSRNDASGPVAFLSHRAGMSGFSRLLRTSTPAGDTTYVWANDLISVTSPATIHFPQSDALGSTRLLADTSGAISDRYAYDAFGQVASHAGSTLFSHLFAGEQNDEASGLVYLRARYYDPRTGVFLSRDPAEGDPFDPLSMHPYLYASGNPVNRIDPSGRETLIEQLNVQSIDATVQKGEEIQNLRNGVKRAEDVTAAVMRDTGAILAVEALVDAIRDRRRVIKWFGGVLGLGGEGAAPGGLDLGGLAAASPLGALPAGDFFGLPIAATVNSVTLGAELALGKGAYDMFNLPKVEIQIQSAGPSAGANTCANHPDYHAVVAPGSAISGVAWYLALCSKFFSDPPLPKAGAISMAGVLVHEFMHITSNRLIRDEGYGCNGRLVIGKPSATEIAKSLVPGAALFNADSYRCWVEDAALNFGNARLAARLPAP